MRTKLVVVFYLLVLSGCWELKQYIKKYTSDQWPPPHGAGRRPSGQPTKLPDVKQNHIKYSCTTQEYDVQQDFDRILGLDAAMVNVLPGMLLEGDQVRDGLFTAIPVRRGPVRLVVDVPLKNSSRRVDSPTLATLRDAVGSLQTAIDAEYPLPDRQRANFTHQTSIVSSFTDSALFFGVDLKYQTPLVNAGLSAVFKEHQTAGTQYFALKHIEELFTITIADDEIPDESGFFASDLKQSEIDELVTKGFLNQGNPPVIVASVTYGRIVLANFRSENQFDSKAFELKVSGGNLVASGAAQISTDFQKLESSSDHKLFALGASAQDAAKAFSTGDSSQIFGPAKATAVYPLYYTIKYISGKRLTAKIGSSTRYTTQECGILGSEDCEYTCPMKQGWADAGPTCSKPGDVSSTFSVYDRDYRLNIDGGGRFQVPAITNAASARVCMKARYNDGGIWNDGKLAFTVYCGNRFFDIWRSDLSPPDHNRQICWDGVPVNGNCGISNVGEVWTPWAQGAGRASVVFWVDQYFTEGKACYDDQWK